LDSGATSHVTPTGEDLVNVRPATAGQHVLDASAGKSEVEEVGTMLTTIGGRNHRLENVLVCGDISDTLISISSWLENSEDGIYLTKTGAYYHKHGDNEMYPIATLEDGLYKMYPLERIKRGKGIARDLVQAVCHGGTPQINVYGTSDGQDACIGVDLSNFDDYMTSGNLDEETEVKTLTSLPAKSLTFSHTDRQTLKLAMLKKELMRIHSSYGHFRFRLILITLRMVLKSDDCKNKKELNRQIYLLTQFEKLYPNMMEFCTTCAIGKIRRLPVGSTDAPAKRLLGRIHTDCVPIPKNKQQHQNGTYVIDGKSRYATIEFHRLKSQHQQIVRNIINQWEDIHTPLRVGAIRHDGGELQKDFATFCETRNPRITNETSPPYAKEFNGFSERNYATIKDAAITMLLQSKLPRVFTSYAISYAIFVKNRLMHPHDETSTPYKMWHGCDADYSKLKPFGCEVTVWQDEKQRNNYYGNRGTKGIFIGYKGDTLAVVWIQAKHRLVITNDIVFHPDQFPGISDSESDTNNLDQNIHSHNEWEAVPIHPCQESVNTDEENSNQDNLYVDLSGDEIYKLSDKTRTDMQSYKIYTMIHSKERHVYPSANQKIFKVEKSYSRTPAHPSKDETISAENLPEPPKSRKAMLESPFKKYFIEAEEVEMKAMQDKGVWKKGPMESGRKLLRPKWIYSYKINKENNTVQRFKARLVAMGHTQAKDIDYDQSFSPVIRINTLRIMLVMALLNDFYIEQADVDTAYLNADLDRVNYMSMPEGYQEKANGGFICLHLLKSIYGLHQSGREWNKLITKIFLEAGFKQALTDPCLFIKRNNKSFIMLYVDDLVIMAKSHGEIEETKGHLRKHFSITELGDAKHILGLQISKEQQGLYLGQPGYAREILQTMGMEDCSTRPTPMTVGWTHDVDSPPLPEDKKKKYHSVVMKLAYLSNQTRPDIAFAVNTLSQYQVDSRENDWNALIRILRYLKSTEDLGLFYNKACNPFATLHTNDNCQENSKWYEPVGFADASHAQESERKSRSGHVMIMAGAAISWYCKKQPVIAISSTEAEYYSLSEAIKEVLWIRQVFDEVGLPINSATAVHQDNMSTIAIAMNPIQHSRVKHMDVRTHFIRDHLDKEDLKLIWCPTEDMIADIFTKALPQGDHRKFTQLLGLRSLKELQENRKRTEYYF
jgi:hypothetical protein